MELITPKCIGGKDCYSICNTKGCSKIPFICVQGCQCQQDHKQCYLNIRWKAFKELFLIQASVQTKNYQKQVEEISNSVLKKIQVSYSQIKNPQSHGLKPIQKDIFIKFHQGRVDELSGNMISQIQLKTQKSQIPIRGTSDLTKRKQLVTSDPFGTKQLLFSNLTKKKQSASYDLFGIKQLVQLEKKLITENKKFIMESKRIRFSSKLIRDVEQIAHFFRNQIRQCRLLYRASENNFQVSEFRRKCKGISSTITILKTAFGNVIGGYTPLQWKNSSITLNTKFSTDRSRQSFIFSLTNNHKLQLMEETKGKHAIGNNFDYGPIFGTADLWICDKADKYHNSYANPGNTYSYNNKYIPGNQQSYKKFSGQSSGYFFKIIEWQVYQLELR